MVKGESRVGEGSELAASAPWKASGMADRGDDGALFVRSFTSCGRSRRGGSNAGTWRREARQMRGDAEEAT